MAQNDIGIDLGTTTIIIAQAGQGVVLNQPSVVAMDTRKNSVLEVGDKALAMVGRTPNYISAIFPLKDGVISDHTMTRELICRFVNQVYSSHMVKPRVAVCVPAAITGIESDAVVEAVMAAGARQVYLIRKSAGEWSRNSLVFRFRVPFWQLNRKGSASNRDRGRGYTLAASFKMVSRLWRLCHLATCFM